MTLEERRKEYLRGYVALKNIPTWMEDLKSEDAKDDLQGKKSLSEKVSLYRGDITLLEVDAIVNAANSSLLGGGGVDGCIHRAAGPCLVAECRNLSGCETGQAKITCGYDLPAKYVIHTVGPIARGHLTDTHKENLANCYKSSLKLAKENNIRSIAFPCISTGIYGFPNEPAAVIALNTAKEWLSKNYNEKPRPFTSPSPSVLDLMRLPATPAAADCAHCAVVFHSSKPLHVLLRMLYHGYSH
nr:O-acetyl-ADP-ribose deacetylase MACROD2 isoform X2 [Columba livia]